MSPQNGHIRCEAKSPSRGPMPSELLSDAAMKARNLRTWLSKTCKREAIAESSAVLKSLPWWAVWHE